MTRAPHLPFICPNGLFYKLNNVLPFIEAARISEAHWSYYSLIKPYVELLKSNV